MSGRFFSPKQVADAIGVSESSLKRWCDRGLLAVHRTAGGHRRLALTDVLNFLRDTGQDLNDPQRLGLPSGTGTRFADLDDARREFYDALREGDEAGSRKAILNLYLDRYSIARICDEVVAPCMHTVGAHWECGQLEVYQERRGCELVERALFELSGLLPPPEPNAPVALGGTPVGDPYRLPTLMVEMTLRELGWQASSYGIGLPLETLRRAVDEVQPRLLWLSVSAFADRDEFLQGYHDLYSTAIDAGVAVVVGGAALSEGVRQRMRYSSYCDNLSHLVSFVRTIAPTPGNHAAAPRNHATSTNGFAKHNPLNGSDN